MSDGSKPADLPSVRRHNLGLLLRELRGRGPLSRAALAGATGLNKVTVSSLVAELIERGLVEEATEPLPTGQAGRPARPLQLAADGAIGLGLWIDVDRFGAALIDLTGAVRWSRVLRRDNRRSRPATLVGKLAALAGDGLHEAQRRRLPVVGSALAVPGLVDPSRGHLYLAPNLGWSDLPLARQLAAELPRMPAPELANEANAAGLAELAARGAAGEMPSDFLFITLGVGVGAGVILGGRLFHGARGFGGELGHTVVKRGGPACACGNRGCLETLVGQDAVLARARKRVKRLPKDDGEALAELSRLASERDAGARAVLKETAEWLATALTTYANLLDPQAIVLGGYGSVLGDALIPAIESRLERSVLSSRWAPCELSTARTGELAALHGAALLGVERVFEDPTLVGAA